MENYSDIPGSLRIPHQAELDAKKTIINEVALKNLGSQNNLAYTYGEGIQIYCQEEKTRWEWKEAIGELQGLLPLDFTYPDGWIGDGIDYSLKSFNFFPVLSYLNLEDKLDKGNYVGTAEDLDNEIQNLKKPNTVLKNITPTIVGLNISAPADSFEWRINQVVFDNTPALAKTLRAASIGFYRKDALLGTNTNSYLIVEGIEGDESVISPSVFPGGTILLGTIDVFGDSATGFLINDTSKVSVFGNGGDTDYIEVNKLGSTFDIRNATSLTGFTIPSANIQYGKDYYLRNSTGGNLTLKSLIGSNNIRFYFPDGNLVVPLNNNVHLKYLSNNEFGGLGYLTLVGIDYRNKVDKVLGYTLTKNDLSDILKASYDSTVTWINTNGSNLINHISRTDNPHNVTALQVGAPSGSGTSTGTNTGDQDLSSLLIKNTLITGNTKTKITYDAKGLVINGSDLVASDIPNITQSQVINLSTTLDSKQNLSEKNIADGYAGLGPDGKILVNQLPSITISDTFVVASQAAMLAVVAETGDIAVRTDLNKSFILKGSSPTVLGNWQELLTPTSSVTTVFGRAGAIQALSGDYTADQITETATRVFQTPLQRLYNDATSSIQTQLNNKEALIGTKLTAFNKNFGTAVSTVAQGNDSRILNGQTAFGWGNHAGLYSPLTGGSGYIQNQNASAQSANMWITGTSRLSSVKATGRFYSTGDSNFDDLVSTTGAIVASYDPINFISNITSRNYFTSTNLPLQFQASSYNFLNGAATFASSVTANGGYSWGNGIYVGGISQLYNDNINGTILISKTGSSRDFVIHNGLGQGVIENPTGTQNLLFRGNGVFSSTVTASNGQLIGGTGTTGYLSKFTSAGGLGNSIIQDNGTFINLANSINIGKDINGIFYNATGAYGHAFYTNSGSNKVLDILSNGNILINTTTDNGVDKLQVNGSVSSTSFKSLTSTFIDNSYWGTTIFSSIGGSNANFAFLKNDSSPIFYSPKNTVDVIFNGVGSFAGNISSNGAKGLILTNGSTWEVSTDLNNMYFNEAGVSTRMMITKTTGAVTVGSSVTASGFFNSSDRRLKTIIKRDGDVAYFKWKDGLDSKTHIGYIAQEVRRKNPDQVQKGEDKMLSVNYVEILVEKVQSLEKRVKQLENGLE